MFRKAETTYVRGQRAENVALNFLKKQGCSLVTRNYRKRGGEIDLIVIDPPSTLVFVEVRYRADTTRGTGAESVTPDKIRKLTLAARHFLVENPRYRNDPCRFDVISMSDDITWYKRAITLDS